MTPEVKPLTCPFCGAAPIEHDEGRIGGGWHIRCVCEPSPSVCDMQYEVALALWNRRAEGAASSVPATDAEAIVAIRDIMELSHRDVLREWTSKKGNVADGSVSIQTMRLALISRALTRHAWSAAPLPFSGESPDTKRAAAVKSEFPCDKCGVKEVYVTVINEDHDDRRIRCHACGDTYVSEGPDA